jgi:hypothetical protein
LKPFGIFNFTASTASDAVPHIPVVFRLISSKKNKLFARHAAAL